MKKSISAAKAQSHKSRPKPKLVEVHGHKLTTEQYLDYCRQLQARRARNPMELLTDSESKALRNVLYSARPSVKLHRTQKLLGLGMDINKLGLEVASLEDCYWASDDKGLREIFTAALAHIAGKIEAKTGALRQIEQMLTKENRVAQQVRS